VYSFEVSLDAEQPFRFSQAIGGGHSDNGGSISLGLDRLEAWGRWREHVSRAGCEWTIPVIEAAIARGAIVLCKVGGAEYLHLIKAIQGERFQIGNNRGRVNGWVSAGSIFGECVKIEP
jgi:hypothetical protein